MSVSPRPNELSKGGDVNGGSIPLTRYFLLIGCSALHVERWRFCSGLEAKSNAQQQMPKVNRRGLY